ncbi:MAG: terpene cyclase/mutase family protein [Chloroflexi bacterium]|nr:terpene cyclase/mutase family protein [Chloroflexota bacterium]
MHQHKLTLSITLGIAFAISLLLALSFNPAPAQAQPPLDPASPTIAHSDAISKALAYLQTQQLPNGSIGGTFDTEFTTIKTVIALRAAHYPVGFLTSVSGTTTLDYLSTRTFSYTRNATGTLSTGRIGMVIAAAVAGNRNPHAFGQYPTSHGSAGLPLDLVKELQTTYNPATGAYSTTASSASTINQLWAVLGLAAAQETVPVSATDFLIGLQEMDGGWGWGFGGDADTTALVIQSLIASGNIEPTRTIVQDGLDFLRNTQADSGGWEAWGSLSVDSTASAIQAIAAAGYIPATASWATDNGRTPHDDLGDLQATDGSFGGNALGTAHAIAGLTETPLPILGRTQRANRALAWINEQQNTDGSWSGWAGPDPGVTCDAVMAYMSAGFDPSTVTPLGGGPSAMAYLSATASVFVTKTADSAGKLAMAVEAAGGDAHNFGGVDIVHTLTNTWYSPTLGIFGDADNTWHQAFAILGLAAAGETIPPSTTQALKDMQDPSDGSWVDAWGFSKPDSTGLILQALIAAGVPNTDTSIVSGTLFLQNDQNDQGGWNFFDTPSANTIAYAIQGLLAAGEDLSADKWLKNGHGPYDALAALQKIDGPFASLGLDNGLATWQAVPALLEKTYPLSSSTLSPFVGVNRGPDPDRLVAAPPRAMWGNSVDVVIPFGSDLNRDGMVSLEWRASGETDWMTNTMVYRVDGYFTATLPVTEVVPYEFQVTFDDPDSVQYNSQTSGTAILPPTSLEPHYIYLPLVLRQ